MTGFIQFISDLLAAPQILIGIIVLIGLVAQRKQAHEVIRGTLKAILGFIIIQQGAGILVGSLNYFGALFQEAFNVAGVVPNNEAIVALALTQSGIIVLLSPFPSPLEIFPKVITSEKFV